MIIIIIIYFPIHKTVPVLIKYDILEENLHSLRQACESLNEQYVTWCESRDQANQSIQKFDQKLHVPQKSQIKLNCI